MAIVIPLPTSVPSFTERVNLGGTTYTLSCYWNQRLSTWFLDLDDAEGNPIIVGRALVIDFPIFGRFRVAGLPPGQLIAQDTSGQNLDPGLNDLGARVQLLFFSNAEIQAA
jgi:hypothetical protein